MNNWGNVSPEEVKIIQQHFQSILDDIEVAQARRVMVDSVLVIVAVLDFEVSKTLEDIANQYFQRVDKEIKHE